MLDISLTGYHFILKTVLEIITFTFFPGVKNWDSEIFPKITQINNRSKFRFRFL